MASTEYTILSNCLVTPATLSESLPLKDFTAVFPQSRQKSAEIPVLYRELRNQRARDIENVKSNITAEAKRGEKQKREVKRNRREWHESDLGGSDGADVRMEADVSLCI